MLTSAIAALSALVFSFRHRKALRIRPAEYVRYYAKSANLALCYRGFIPSWNLRAAQNAGKAAFYCCAYDVVTDWRSFNPLDYTCFRRLLIKEVNPELSEIAFGLYEQELNHQLRLDGLSRGGDALAFVTGLIGSDLYLKKKTDFQALGLIMQIVDDILDFDHDQRRNEVNCLASPRRDQYLVMLMEFDTCALKTILPGSQILCAVIRIAQRKAANMLLVDLQNARNQRTLPVHEVKKGLIRDFVGEPP